MPVRIYDIAKKLGIESKEVLVWAKELGIAGAKVPSSSLDKITAEYLEDKIAATRPKAPEPTPAAPVPPPPPPPLPEPVEAPPPQPAVQEPEPPPVLPVAPVEIAPAVEAKVPAPQTTEVPSETVPAPPAVEATEAQPHVSPAPAPAVSSPPPPPQPVEAAAANPVVSEPAAAPSVPETSAEPVAVAPAAPAAIPVAVPVAAAPQAPPVAAPAPPAPAPAPAPATPPPPAPPAAPAGPRIGDKIGFIQLAPRPKPSAGKPAPSQGQARPQPQGRPAPPGRPNMPGRPGPGGRSGPPQQQFGGRSGQNFQRPGSQPPAPAPQAKPGLPSDAPVVMMKPPVVVRELADALKRKPFQLIADLMEMGVFANVNQTIDEAIATRLCAKHGVKFEIERRQRTGTGVTAPVAPQQQTLDAEDKLEDLRPRAPVVTIMGHVDHGKTSLLDVIRKSDVAGGEAGGITQHIGAYTITVPHPDKKDTSAQITFLDTPGHAAFSAMRARGAKVTDIVVLVVAATDGVMPQTIEAMSHAQAAKVPILVAVNKCDHPNANPMKVRQQLQERGLVSDEWGGDTIFVDVSALTKQGIDKLLEMIVLQADLLELKANPTRRAKGNVVESGLEQGGPTATVLVRKGTLRVGETVVCSMNYGKVRALINEEGKRLKEAGPSVAVKLLGLNGIPEAGEEFIVVENEKTARQLCEERTLIAKAQEQQERRPKVTLENLFDTLAQEQAKLLKIVVKADTQGSVEAIVEALKKIESSKVALEIIHHAVGTITESDVLLASASKAIILGFHTRVDNSVPEVAKREGVQIKLYAIIYELIDQVKEAMAGLLDPLVREVVIGSAEVRKLFELSKGGKVAGCVVSNGRLVKGKMRVMRRKNLIYEGVSLTLRRFQDDVNEVRAGMECGIRLDGFDDFVPGDAIECYTLEKVPQKLI